MNINVSICKSVSDKWELFDSKRDMAGIGRNFLPLKVLTINKMPSTSKKIDILVKFQYINKHFLGITPGPLCLIVYKAFM